MHRLSAGTRTVTTTAGQQRAAGWGEKGVFLGVGEGAGEEREGRRFLNECKILRAQKREGREGPRGGKGWREKGGRSGRREEGTGQRLKEGGRGATDRLKSK